MLSAHERHCCDLVVVSKQISKPGATLCGQVDSIQVNCGDGRVILLRLQKQWERVLAVQLELSPGLCLFPLQKNKSLVQWERVPSQAAVAGWKEKKVEVKRRDC